MDRHAPSAHGENEALERQLQKRQEVIAGDASIFGQL
jgi:hypothetical protein